MNYYKLVAGEVIAIRGRLTDWDAAVEKATIQLQRGFGRVTNASHSTDGCYCHGRFVLT